MRTVLQMFSNLCVLFKLNHDCLWDKRLVFVYVVHGNLSPFWFDDYSCFYTPPLCNWPSIGKCAPSFTVASRCFNNGEHAQTILCPIGLLTVFFGESVCFSVLSIYPWLHIPELCDVSLFSPCFWFVHSQSWWLIKLSWPSSFYSIPFFMFWEAFLHFFFFFSSVHTDCTAE